MKNAEAFLAMCRPGQKVRYRTATRDDPSGTRPDWSEWQTGELHVSRRTHPLPARLRNRARNPNVGDILSLHIYGLDGFPEFSGSDYFPDHNEWMVEEYRMQFEVITP